MIDEWGGSLLPSCHNWSIVNGWKNSSSAFFTTRYSFISSETLDAMKKSEKKRERNNSGEMTWKYSYVYVSLSLFLPFPPYFSVFFNKIDKKVDKTSAISTAYFARLIVTSPPSIRYSKERGKRTKGTRYLPNLFANRHAQTLTYVQKWNFIKVTWKRPNVGGNRVPFRVFSKIWRGRSIGIHFAKVAGNSRGWPRRLSDD